MNSQADGATPLEILALWIEEAVAAGAPAPRAVAFTTVGGDGCPSARTVSLKGIEARALLFTSALWTRKAQEIRANPNVALLFYWPSLGRQAHIAGTAAVAERALATELFAERERSHQVQTLVSRQGEVIDDLAPLRARHAHLMQALEASPDCPQDWGAIRVVPHEVELWEEAADRMHKRRLYEHVNGEWLMRLLAP